MLTKKEYMKPVIQKEELKVTDIITTSVSRGSFVTTSGSYGVTKSYTEIFGTNHQ